MRAPYTASRAALDLRKDDFYASPPEAAYALLSVEQSYLPKSLWEPACGDGALVNPLRSAGYTVIATDLVDRGCPVSDAGCDFLLFDLGIDVGGIVTNPPFKLAQEFAERALDYAPYVALLLRLAFLESEVRRPFFERHPPAAIHVFSQRLPMMHRHGYDGPRHSNSGMAFAWFVWDAARGGRREISWISPADIRRGETLSLPSSVNETLTDV